MELPHLSHLQFEVLRILSRWPNVSGSELRGFLKEKKSMRQLPAFYQLMRRLREMKAVEVEYKTKQTANQVVTESLYSITKIGRSEIDKSKAFYS